MVPFLGVELRFRVDTRVVPWGQTIAALLRWEPELAPTHLDRLSDADADGPEAWSEALWPELARRCAEAAGTVWTLTREKGRRSMTWVRRRSQVECSIAVPRPRGDVLKYFAGLVGTLEAGIVPAMAMAFDGDSKDAGLMVQGLHALDEVPPLLFLARETAERLGLYVRTTAAPCEAVTIACGTVLVVRPDPFARPAREELRRARDVARWLGIARGAPLRLL
jgi:hypothetical protein